MKELSNLQMSNIKLWATEAFERADFECQIRKGRKEVQGNWLAVKTLSGNILKSLGEPLPTKELAPWRRVVEHVRMGVRGNVKNVLECGHSTKIFSGEAAQDALTAKKHRCPQCGNMP